MHKYLQFLAKKSVFLFGLALVVLANPFTYFIIGSIMLFVKSADNPSISFNTHDQFIQAMIFTSSLGFIIAAMSKVSSWILAFRKIKSSKA